MYITDSDNGPRSGFLLGTSHDGGHWFFAPWPLCSIRTMTPPPVPEDVRSPDSFEAHLNALVAAALHNGVDPRGAWEYRARDGEGDYEIEIVELDGGHRARGGRAPSD